MIGSIKLTRFTSNVDAGQPFAQHNWPLTVHATGKDDMPGEVFVFSRAEGVFGDPSQYDQFRCVASAHDIFEISVNRGSNPSGEWHTPFYRSSVLRLFLRSSEEVEEIWIKIKEDVHALIKNLEAENKMKAVDQTDITVLDTDPVTTSETVDELNETADQVLLTLDYRPAGIADVDGDNNQSILSPDDSLTGWLPVSEAPQGMNVPNNARFFYNASAEPSVNSELPFMEPGNVHLFYMNGLKLTHGQTYHINSTGIFWISFDPVESEDDVVFQDGDVLLSQDQTGNAPWPLDYVDRNSPGSSVPNYELLLYRE